MKMEEDTKQCSSLYSKKMHWRNNIWKCWSSAARHDHQFEKRRTGATCKRNLSFLTIQESQSCITFPNPTRRSISGLENLATNGGSWPRKTVSYRSVFEQPRLASVCTCSQHVLTACCCGQGEVSMLRKRTWLLLSEIWGSQDGVCEGGRPLGYCAV
jgi:hypothetical protein